MSNPHTMNQSRPAKRPPRRPNPWLIVCAVLICLAIGLVVAGRIVFGTRETEAPAAENFSSPGASKKSVAETLPPNDVAVSSSTQALLVDDDGRTLWASPTDGTPLDLAYLPPGVQIAVALRVEAISKHREGEKVRAALGPLGERAIEFAEQVTHVKWPNMKELVAGFQTSSDGRWHPTFVIHTEDGASLPLPAGLDVATEKEHGGEPYWIAHDRAYYRPAQSNGKMLVVAPVDAVEDIIDLAGEPPPLRRDIERLLAHTDADRHVTIILAPNSLFSEGQSIFAGGMAGLRNPLFWFLGDELSAAALSMHWDENFFVELLATPTLDTPPERAARILNERIAQVPDKLEEYVVGLDASPHSRRVIERFPGMVRTLTAYTRSGFEPDHAVLRCYLPQVAGHNLLMGAELTLAERFGATRTVAEATALLVAADNGAAADESGRIGLWSSPDGAELEELLTGLTEDEAKALTIDPS
ncbi:MAG: hypothetical protein WD229_04405, partial [Pirellulales bacterium]